MHYRLIAPAVVAFVAMSCSASGGVASSSFVAGSTELAIDGAACGKLFSFDGGDPRANAVVVSNPGGTALPKKQISGVNYAPITVEMAFPPAPPILGWIGDLCANRQTPKTLLLTRFNANGQVAASALQANNVRLTEVRFPVLDTASKDPVRLALVFTPESTQAVPASAAAKSAAAAVKVGSGGNFKIQIGGLPSSRVARIEAITIKQPSADNAVGDAKKFGAAPGAPEFSNLILTISSVDLTDWNNWRDNFVVNGKNDDASEISGSLDLLANDQTKLMALQFSHIGILRASPEKEGGSDATARFQAELYCEGIAPGTALAASSTPVATGPAATLTPIAAMTPVTAKTATLLPVAGTAPAGGAAGSTAAGGAGKTDTPADAGADPRAESSAPAPSSGSSTKGGEASPSGGADPHAAETAAASAPAGSSGKNDPAGGAAAAQAHAGESAAPGAASGSSAGAAASGGGGAAKEAAAPTAAAPAAPVPPSRATGLTPVPAVAPPLVAATAAPSPILIDQGARDPKDFPRPEGIVRKSFSSVRQKTYSQEIAAYSSKSTPDALEEWYTKSLTAAGWELGTRVENNGSIANTHQIVLTWKNGLRSVMITLAEAKAGGAEIGVNLTTKFAP